MPRARLQPYTWLMQPQLPRQISEYAKACLEALSVSGLGNTISLGGAFGLMHYFEYRPTYDVDAWWHEQVTTAEQQKVVQVLTTALETFGSVHVRSWGDVTSIELQAGSKKVFSFQIARRSAQLEPAVPSAWPGVLLDSFHDLVASKMVALVERGAPRDFLDIFTLCQSGQVTAVQCWQLWQQRQEAAGDDPDTTRAMLAIETHLARIEQHRPLTHITDTQAREAAATVREWYKTEFLNVLN